MKNTILKTTIYGLLVSISLFFLWLIIYSVSKENRKYNQERQDNFFECIKNTDRKIEWCYDKFEKE